MSLFAEFVHQSRRLKRRSKGRVTECYWNELECFTNGNLLTVSNRDAKDDNIYSYIRTLYRTEAIQKDECDIFHLGIYMYISKLGIMDG